jgi:hypothetical protein
VWAAPDAGETVDRHGEHFRRGFFGRGGLVILFIVLFGLIALGILALLYGEDSRPTIADTHRWPSGRFSKP